MKKTKKILIFIFIFIILLGNSILYADMGPKPSLTIHLENLESDDYSLDLLVDHSDDLNDKYYQKSFRHSFSNLDKMIYEYHEQGFIAEAMRNSLLWCRQVDENTWHFEYIGCPDQYKIIIAYPNGIIKVSDLITSEHFDEEITVDVRTMETKFSTSRAYEIIMSHNIINYLTPLVITIVVELLISLFFIKKSIRNSLIIIVTNFITNFALQFIIISLYENGYYKLYLFLAILLEIIIVLIEMIIYSLLLKGTEKKTIIKYTLIANVITMLLTAVISDFIFDNLGNGIKQVLSLIDFFV